jgi:hypothetical protein
MIIRNYYDAELKLASSHKGTGQVKIVKLYDDGDFEGRDPEQSGMEPRTREPCRTPPSDFGI